MNSTYEGLRNILKNIEFQQHLAEGDEAAGADAVAEMLRKSTLRSTLVDKLTRQVELKEEDLLELQAQGLMKRNRSRWQMKAPTMVVSGARGMGALAAGMPATSRTLPQN